MLKISENNGTEEIGLVTPTPGPVEKWLTHQNGDARCWSALWLLMPWCKSTRSSATTILTYICCRRPVLMQNGYFQFEHKVKSRLPSDAIW